MVLSTPGQLHLSPFLGDHILCKLTDIHRVFFQPLFSQATWYLILIMCLINQPLNSLILLLFSEFPS